MLRCSRVDFKEIYFKASIGLYNLKEVNSSCKLSIGNSIGKNSYNSLNTNHKFRFTAFYFHALPHLLSIQDYRFIFSLNAGEHSKYKKDKKQIFSYY